VIWITTANDARGIPEPILNRMNVFEIQPPTPAQARVIARNLYTGIRREHDWGKHFEVDPSSDTLDALSDLPPREMRRALMTAFGNARLAQRGQIRPDDLPKPEQGKSKIGFVH
jgi:ATP-dependent Lon protease